MAAEHVPSHHRGADVRKRLLDQCAARVDLAAFEAVHRPPDGERKDPLVQAHTANSKGIVHALAGTGGETIERHRDPEAQL